MANELLLQALEECKARRFDNQAEERRRLALAISLSPQIGELEQERREGIIKGLQLAIEGVRPEGIEEQTRRINSQILALLKQNDLPEDYLEPVFQCLDCRDSGYTGTVPRALCGCVSRRYHELLSGDLAQDNGPSFERFDPRVFPEVDLDDQGTTQRMLMEVIRRHAARFADEVPGGRLNLLLYGPSGLGKTYVLHSIARRVRERGTLTLTLNANALLNHIRQAYFSREDEVEQPYYTVPLLLIDDLGTEPLWENITLEQLFALLEHRIQNRLHTVISTNLPLEKIRERYTARIYSRLLDQRNSLALQFQGQDVRLHRPQG
ncbi:MAG: ATP-binding protein [Clostridiales bacterium]|nr:ATP-binding protein [Clostridiales bacterium]